MNEQNEGDPSTGGAPQAPAQSSYTPDAPSLWRRWGWPILVVALAAIGVLLAIADTALYGPKLGPYPTFLIGQSATKSTTAQATPEPERFVRTRFPEQVTFGAPFWHLGTVSPMQALRAFLSNGAGLVLFALGVLLLFPGRARVAVNRLEARYGPEIALAAGVATLLLAVGAVLLLRFTLFFLVVIPVVLIVALATSIFGIACIGLALGRLLARRLHMAPAHPLVVALTGALVVFDLAVIPYAGAIALAAVAIAGLGLAVVTRFGSDTGWSFKDLDW